MCGSICQRVLRVCVCVLSGQHVFLTWVTLCAWCWFLRRLGHRPRQEAEGGLCVRQWWSWSDKAFGLPVLLTRPYPAASSSSSFFVCYSNSIFLLYWYAAMVYGVMSYVIMSVCLCVDTLFSQKHFHQTDWTVCIKTANRATMPTRHLCPRGTSEMYVNEIQRGKYLDNNIKDNSCHQKYDLNWHAPLFCSLCRHCQ